MSRDGTPARPWSRTLALIGVVALTAETGRAQTPRPDPAGPFRPVRFDENYSYLRDSVRHGWRQEPLFGGSRTFSPRDPANVRRSFEAVRGGWVGRRVALDGFWGRQVRVGPGVFSDPRDSTRFTWGAFGTVTLEPTHLWLDAYLFRDHRDAARFAQGTAPTNRWAAGAVSRGRRGQWEWNVEAMYQWGRFGSAPINAYVGIWDVAYTFRTRWRPPLALRGPHSSGDRDPNDPPLQSLDPLYPSGFVMSGGPLGPVNLTNA